MKNKLWLLQIPIVTVFTLAFYISELGVEGTLESKRLREGLYPAFQRISGLFTDVKFRLRGPVPPKNKVVIVEIDSESIERIGRWPWHRDYTAALIERVFDLGAKVVGLDMVFSESDKRVSDELAVLLKQHKLGDYIDRFETDPQLEKVIRKYSDRLVLGWATEQLCQPLYDGAEGCPVNHPEAIALLPPGFEKFSFSMFRSSTGFNSEKSPFLSVLTVIANIPSYNKVGSHAGSFNITPDPDGIIRRASLLMMINGRPHPPLPLEMARVGLGEQLQLTLNERQRVASLGFLKSGLNLPVTPVGAMEVNFRGPGRTFKYLPALDVLTEGDLIDKDSGRELAGLSKKELLKDAYVLIGLSAVGVYDMRAFPFDENVPGVEGHANILDNILSMDALRTNAMMRNTGWIYFLMIIIALTFGYLTQRLDAIPAVALFVTAFLGFAWIDIKVLFQNSYNWHTSFFYLEMFAIFFFTLAAKYMIEERNKKFIRSAFTKYVAPAVVDEILKDPTKLTVGGEKKDLTILFSDIRGFTTFSERMDAKKLSAMLNDYLGMMTKTIFENQGTLDKYIGDAIMAFWGAPLDQPIHAHNATHSAIEMIRTLDANRDRIKEQYGVEIDIGIGLNSGVVSVGNMGSDSNFAYTVIGDHVNLASRLEGLTKAYGVTILTSRFTFDNIIQSGKTVPPHRVLDDVKVKGKKKAIELIQLLEREYSEDGLRAFQEGRELYRKQKWDEAIAKFKVANGLLVPTHDRLDGPCEVFIERCEEFKKNPPAPDWDGSWEMTSK